MIAPLTTDLESFVNTNTEFSDVTELQLCAIVKKFFRDIANICYWYVISLMAMDNMQWEE